jgi:hypothetical protein
MGGLITCKNLTVLWLKLHKGIAFDQHSHRRPELINLLMLLVSLLDLQRWFCYIILENEVIICVDSIVSMSDTKHVFHLKCQYYYNFGFTYMEKFKFIDGKF